MAYGVKDIGLLRALVEHPRVLAQGNEGRQLVMHLNAERACRALRDLRDHGGGVFVETTVVIPPASVFVPRMLGPHVTALRMSEKVIAASSRKANFGPAQCCLLGAHKPSYLGLSNLVTVAALHRQNS